MSMTLAQLTGIPFLHACLTIFPKAILVNSFQGHNCYVFWRITVIFEHFLLDFLQYYLKTIS